MTLSLLRDLYHSRGVRCVKNYDHVMNQYPCGYTEDPKEKIISSHGRKWDWQLYGKRDE